jgi:hypothetical protein
VVLSEIVEVLDVECGERQTLGDAARRDPGVVVRAAATAALCLGGQFAVGLGDRRVAGEKNRRVAGEKTEFAIQLNASLCWCLPRLCNRVHRSSSPRVTKVI